ncbi:hypothetical protein GTW36_21000 [Vibrio parahaemolyticus]|nr:hypothetical protein [Vibrio parahaemolyticus]EGQ9049392.1 hypothetical protein [Vibrio parahaemolyticus]EGQ9145810.1 hypothetical protein [Vibrio parahaemolyticus]EGQ9586019.1 hypothetical protein [Vibrio parahaemolyticus]EGR1001618.1 hypothetical protein [Vibrio parahaemolyticus]
MMNLARIGLQFELFSDTGGFFDSHSRLLIEAVTKQMAMYCIKNPHTAEKIGSKG